MPVTGTRKNPKNLGDIYPESSGGWRVKVTIAKKTVNGPLRQCKTEALADLARARKCQTQEEMRELLQCLREGSDGQAPSCSAQPCTSENADIKDSRFDNPRMHENQSLIGSQGSGCEEPSSPNAVSARFKSRNDQLQTMRRPRKKPIRCLGLMEKAYGLGAGSHSSAWDTKSISVFLHEESMKPPQRDHTAYPFENTDPPHTEIRCRI